MKRLIQLSSGFPGLHAASRHSVAARLQIGADVLSAMRGLVLLLLLSSTAARSARSTRFGFGLPDIAGVPSPCKFHLTSFCLCYPCFPSYIGLCLYFSLCNIFMINKTPFPLAWNPASLLSLSQLSTKSQHELPSTAAER